MTLFSSFVAVALLAQSPAGLAPKGEVVDDQGKPIADAQVVFYAPPTVYGRGDPVEAQTRSDAEGKFGLKIPPLKRILINGVNFLAYRPGLAITAHPFFMRPHRLVLEKPLPRTVLVAGPDGKPVAGARIRPLLFLSFGNGSTDIPASLAEPMAITTGPDGHATLNYLAARDRIMAVRVSADAIGTQDILLLEPAGAGAPSEPSVITIKLKPTTHLAGRIIDQVGQPIAGQLVELWSRGDGTWSAPNTVEFKSGPLRSAADGSFQTPGNLMVGSTYRVAIRADGKEPIFSDWITMSDKPRHFPVVVLRPLRTVRGQVVDRQGKPVAGVEVFQSGDGPERTDTRTDTAGRFSLGGFRQGPVFVFTRGDGFRFQGRLIKPDETEVTIELARTSERPAREMKMLGDPIPFEESQRPARRLADPLWALVGAEGPDNERFTTLSDLASVDPARVLGLVETVKFRGPIAKARLQREVALALAPFDFEEASTVAESIDDDATRSTALVDLADTLPHMQRERKLALLDRALLAARNAKNPGGRLLQMGDVAERWFELGQVDKAKDLFVLGLRLASQLTDKTDIRRGWFAGRLASVSPAGALAIAKDFDGERSQSRILAGIVFRLIDHNPAEAERVWNQTKGMGRLARTDPTLCWKMATVDPARARRVIDSTGLLESRPELQLFLALGSKTRDPSVSRQTFQAGLDGIDKKLRENPERYQIVSGTLLPIVERIDPGLVPEIFWRDVSSRLPAGNPRTLGNDSRTELIIHLAWYDREVARALFEPSRVRLSSPGDDVSAPSDSELMTAYWAWSIFDPRAAVAQLEKLPIDPQRPNDAIRARLVVAKSLAQNHEQRWHDLWDRRWGIILGGTKREF